MNTLQRGMAYWNRKVSAFGILEVNLAQGAAMGFTLLLVKFFPCILELSAWWFVALIVVCAVPVHYTLWFRKAPPPAA